MKSITLAVLVSFLLLSGVSIAAQPEERKDHSSMMQETTKGGKQAEREVKMMRMMKMMDQCADMMEAAHNAQVSRESQKK